MNNLDQFLDEDEIKKYRIGFIKGIIGLGALSSGFLFDYKSIDDILVLGGAFLVGWNLRKTIEYIKYKFSKKNPYQ